MINLIILGLLIIFQVVRCTSTNISASKVLQFTELIQRALRNDKQSRDQGKGPSFAELSVHTKMDALTKVSAALTCLKACLFLELNSLFLYLFLEFNKFFSHHQNG